MTLLQIYLYLFRLYCEKSMEKSAEVPNSYSINTHPRQSCARFSSVIIEEIPDKQYANSNAKPNTIKHHETRQYNN